MELHRRIRTLRAQHGLTGMELARRAGVSASYVSLIEHGEKIPSEDVAVRLARVLEDSEDLYRVWSALARMDSETRNAFFRLRRDEVDALISAGGEAAMKGFGAGGGGDGDVSGQLGIPTSGAAPMDATDPTLAAASLEMLRHASTSHAVSIPLLLTGAIPSPGEPLRESDVEGFLAFDRRLLPDAARTSSLVAMRVDTSNGRRVATWLAPGEIVLVDGSGDTKPDDVLSKGGIHAFSMRDFDVVLARANLSGSILHIFSDPTSSDPPVALDLSGGESLRRIHLGRVVWSGRVVI